MKLTGAISNLKHAKVMGGVQMRVARKILDVQQYQGDAAVKLIEAAAQTAATAGDSLVAVATGLGGSLDVYG